MDMVLNQVVSPHHPHTVTADSGNQKKILIAAFLTAIYMSIEIIGGFWVNSIALIADGVLMLTDSLALLIAWWGFYIAQRPATNKMTFGYQRAQILTAFVNGILLLIICIAIMIMSIDRMMNPQPVMGQDMLIIAIIGLFINLIVFGILHSGDQKNINMRGATLHFLGDTLASIAVITAAIIIYFTEWHIIDPILSISVAIIIAFNALKLSKSATLILLEAAPEGYHIEDITNDLEKNFPQLKQIHHIHLWAISDEQVMMTFHAKTDLNHINDHTLKSIKTYLNEKHSIHHVTLQLET